MLWQPVTIKHPEDLLIGSSMWGSVLEAIDTDLCECGHSAREHSCVGIAIPRSFNEGAPAEATVRLMWHTCHYIPILGDVHCTCPGFWRH